MQKGYTNITVKDVEGLEKMLCVPWGSMTLEDLASLDSEIYCDAPVRFDKHK